MEAVDTQSLLEECAINGEFYCHTFFPRAFRKDSPPMHMEAWAALESHNRYVSVEIARGFAKTTLLRAFTSKRVAFLESRTILYVSETQDHAKRSVRWLRRQIQFNTKWANFFGLSLGSKKTDEWLEIQHSADQMPITVLAVGITGQTRGINLDDFRPDLIIVDDPCDEENTSTPEQRKKIEDLFFGALAKSLVPPTESDNALMALLQTPLHQGDLISLCGQDPQWTSLRFGCFDEKGESRWPELFPTAFLKEEKQAHVNRNQLALWLREMECTIVDEATSAFKASWLKDYPEGMTPQDLLDEGAQAFLWIDPVPPPSERQLAMGLKDKDYEVLAVVLKWRGAVYLAEYVANRGHEPDWTIMQFWRLVDAYRVVQFGVEPVGYQRTLRWLLEKSMQQRGRYISVYVQDKADRRKKSYRIIDSLTGICSQGQFYVIRSEHGDFITQFISYPSVEHDDIIESVSEATRIAQESMVIEAAWSEIEDEEGGDRLYLGACP